MCLEKKERSKGFELNMLLRQEEKFRDLQVTVIYIDKAI